MQAGYKLCCGCRSELPPKRVDKYCTDCRRAYNAEWRARDDNRAKQSAASKASHAVERESISDTYIAHLLKKCGKEPSKRNIRNKKEEVLLRRFGEKVCFTCKIQKQASEFVKAKKTVTGLTSSCKECLRKKVLVDGEKTYLSGLLRLKNIEVEENSLRLQRLAVSFHRARKDKSLAAENEGKKICAHCGVTSHKSNFGKCKSRKDGLSVYCKDCIRLRSRWHRRRKGAKEFKPAVVADGLKRCPRCSKVLPFKFFRSVESKSKLPANCLACERLRHQERRVSMTEEEKEKRREIHRMYTQFKALAGFVDPVKVRESQKKWLAHLRKKTAKRQKDRLSTIFLDNRYMDKALVKAIPGSKVSDFTNSDRDMMRTHIRSTRELKELYNDNPQTAKQRNALKRHSHYEGLHPAAVPRNLGRGKEQKD